MMSRIYTVEEILEQVKETNGRILSIKRAEKDIEKDFHQNVVLLGEENSNKHLEGKLTKVFVNRYERNDKARKECIEHYGAICQVCKFDFEKTYGDIGKGYIHVHHIKPLHKIGEEYEIDAVKDLIPVCANCHAMLHHKGNCDIDITVEELKRMILKIYGEVESISKSLWK